MFCEFYIHLEVDLLHLGFVLNHSQVAFISEGNGPFNTCKSINIARLAQKPTPNGPKTQSQTRSSAAAQVFSPRTQEEEAVGSL